MCVLRCSRLRCVLATYRSWLQSSRCQSELERNDGASPTEVWLRKRDVCFQMSPADLREERIPRLGDL